MSVDLPGWAEHNAEVRGAVAIVGEGFCPMPQHATPRPRLVPTGHRTEEGVEKAQCPACRLHFALTLSGEGYEASASARPAP